MLIFISSGCGKEEITFQSGDVELSGALYMPDGTGPFPAIIFVHGSGPETKDNSSYSAKWLQSLGYVVLTYDKRGAGDSEGDKNSINRFNFEKLSDDVVAGIRYLASHDKVNKNRIGVHASSQGGWVVPLAASKSDLISFMIVKSASVCSVGEDRVYERSERLKSEGFTAEEILEATEMQVVEAKISPGDNNPDEFTSLFIKFQNKPWFKRVYPGTDPFKSSLVEYRKWYATVVNFNSIPYLEDLDIPVYWIFGDAALDKQGPVELSISNLKKLNRDSYVIQEIPEEGHNIDERKYERPLYDWLCEVNDYHEIEFKKH